MHNNYPKFTALARKFPTFAAGSPLRDTPGIEPFDAMALNSWVKQDRGSSGQKLAARFVLMAFNSSVYGDHFDLAEALRVWDRDHRAVLSAFIMDPDWG